MSTYIDFEKDEKFKGEKVKLMKRLDVPTMIYQRKAEDLVRHLSSNARQSYESSH